MGAARRAFASLVLGAGLGLLVAGGAPRADMATTATGVLKLDDQPTALAHAYIIEEETIPEMRFGDEPSRSYTLLLTDRPIADGFTPSVMSAHQLSFDGRLRGIGLDLNPETGEVMSGRTLLPEAEGPQFFSVITLGAEPMVVLEDWAEADGRLRGRVRTPEPLEVVNFHDDPNLPKLFAFEASFDAEIIRAPEMVETLEGEAASGSEQVAALRRFLDAIAARDLAGIRAAVATGDPMAEGLTPEDVEMMNAVTFDSFTDTDAVLANLRKVYVFDDGSAVVVLDHGEGAVSTYPLEQDAGTWKMGQP